MKTYLTMLSALLVSVALIGCGEGEHPPADPDTAAVPPVDDASTESHDGTQ